VLQLLFFCSGVSGLIYQVVWVRSFGNVFGNTIYSASLVVAVFMAGLGAGSYLVGAWADRRYATQPESLLRTYAYVELLIALMGLGISAFLPHLGQVSAFVSSYSREPAGWFALSATSYLARARHRDRLAHADHAPDGRDAHAAHSPSGPERSVGKRMANCGVVRRQHGGRGARLFPDGLHAGTGRGLQTNPDGRRGSQRRGGCGSVSIWRRAPSVVRLKPDTTKRKAVRSVRLQPDPGPQLGPSAVILTSLAIAMAGFAAMGMEILWLRHFSILLGAFRAVFSLLLTVILLGIVVGSLIGGILHRRLPRAAEWFMAAQGLFVVATLLGLAMADARPIEAAAAFDPTRRWSDRFRWSRIEHNVRRSDGTDRTVVQREADPAGGRNTCIADGIQLSTCERHHPTHRRARSAGVPAPCISRTRLEASVGSLVAGFLLLPSLGIQASATVLATLAALAVVPLYLSGIGDQGSGIGIRDRGSGIGVLESPGRRCSLPPRRSWCGCCYRRITSTHGLFTGCRGRSGCWRSTKG
jgi:spermidine synthase